MKLPLAIAGLSLLACAGLDPAGETGGKTGSTSDTVDTADDIPVIGAPDDVVIDDQDDGLVVTIDGSEATGWLLGVAWPAQSYEDEACKGSDDFCHPLDADGGTVDWCPQHEGEDGCTGIPQLYYRQGQVSLMLKPEVGLGCWAWGDEADYWSDCEAMGWDDSSY